MTFNQQKSLPDPTGNFMQTLLWHRKRQFCVISSSWTRMADSTAIKIQPSAVHTACGMHKSVFLGDCWQIAVNFRLVKNSVNTQHCNRQNITQPF